MNGWSTVEEDFSLSLYQLDIPLSVPAKLPRVKLQLFAHESLPWGGGAVKRLWSQLTTS